MIENVQVICGGVRLDGGPHHHGLFKSKRDMLMGVSGDALSRPNICRTTDQIYGRSVSTVEDEARLTSAGHRESRADKNARGYISGGSKHPHSVRYGRGRSWGTSVRYALSLAMDRSSTLTTGPHQTPSKDPPHSRQ
eukprot:scaffold322713_cov31-Tisochrysis_lutea.AAC.1